MFSLVDDVLAYPQRFDWCEAAHIIGQRDDVRVARLDVRLSGLRTSFTTRNRLVPGERIEMSLVDGPFRALNGTWRFTQLGASGSKVELLLDFEMVGKLVGSALAIGFQHLADRMVGDFVRVAGSMT